MARPTLNQHRKFRRLKVALGSAIIARGVLELLWDACYESGDDYVGTSADVENLVGWTGEAGILAKALVEAGAPEGFGFLEPVTEGGSTFRVHDLWHHAPDYVAKRRKREMARQDRIDPEQDRRAGGDRRTAPDGGQCPPTSDSLPGLARTHAPAPALALAPAPALVDDLVDLWNQLVSAPIPKVTKITPGRRQKINARLQSYPDLATWRTVIEWINGQGWCRAPGVGEHPNWAASIDWLCKSDDQVQKYIERAEQNQQRTRPRLVGCRHQPPCADAVACTSKSAAERRAIPA